MKTISQDIKNNDFKRVYLLYGPESYLRLYWANRLCDAVLPSSDSLNRARFDGAAATENAIIDFAETMPFLAERRLVRVQDSGFFKKSLDRLPDYLKRIPDYTTIVFVETEIDKRSRLYKAVSANGYAAEFPIQDERTLLRWGAGLLARAKIRIREEDMRYLLARTGPEMSRLSTEIDKLVHYLRGREMENRRREEALAEAYALEEARREAELAGYSFDPAQGQSPSAAGPEASDGSLPRSGAASGTGAVSPAAGAALGTGAVSPASGAASETGAGEPSLNNKKAAFTREMPPEPATELAATRADIDAVTTVLLEDHIFDMLRAVVSRETDRVLALYAELLGLKEPPIRILVMLEREFNRLLFVKDLTERRASVTEIEKETGIRGFAIRRYQGQLRSLPRETILRAVRLLADTDENIKSGRISDRIGVELALVELAAL